MKKRTMKVLSLIVAIVMAISILPLAALAEETGPKRQVGVVVYGAELTAMLADMEQEIKNVQNLAENPDQLLDGTVVDNVSGTLERLQTLATNIGTKFVDGSGISVPDVDVEIISNTTGKTYTLKEDTSIELFTETVETYVPFQQDVEKEINQIKTKIEELKAILKKYDVLGMIDTFDSLGENFESILTDLTSLSQDIIGGLGSLTGMNGMLYRTYVTDDAIPVGDYTVKVKGFSDTDETGKAITRDGYILYNDGLTENGSGFNTERSFEVEIKEQDMFDHAIQFVGPENGIIGKFDIPEPLNSIYDTTAGLLNTLADTMEGLMNKLSGKDDTGLVGSITSLVTGIAAKITNTEDLLEWLRTWETPRLKTGDELDLSYKFAFPGLWCAESDAGFTFTNVDVAEAGLNGSDFLLVNRDEIVNILKIMKDLGKDAFNGAIKATFGGTVTYTDGTVATYDSILKLYTELIKTEDGQLSLDYDTAYSIIKAYIAVITDLNLTDRVLEKDSLTGIIPTKLKVQIPAILKATSDENGQVTFSKNNNITLTWILDITRQIMEKGGDALKGKNDVLDLLLTVVEYADTLVGDFAGDVINTLVYPFAQRMGLVGKKMASGKYIMFQIKAADEYWINPLAYTMILTWENDTWLYVTVADLGIIMPYFAEGFYDFVRKTTFAGTIDKFLSQMTGKEVNVISDVLTDKIDLTKEINKTVTGALTAFVGMMGFNSLGLDSIFTTKSDFVTGLNQYLYENGRTAQNLMIYVNKQAQRAKSVYAGYVDEDWYFYNLDKSPTTTATKLIDKSTKDIAATFVNPTKASIVTQTGNTVSKVVNTIGTKVETTVQNVKTQIKSTIGAAVKSTVKNVFTSVANTAKNMITNFFKNIFSKAGSGMITFNA